MFKYTLQPSGKKMIVDLPDKLEFNYDFLESVSNLVFQVETAPCDQVTFRCKPNVSYEKLCKAYLYNVFAQIKAHKPAFWNRSLQSTIMSSVHSQKGADFPPINEIDILKSRELDLYIFRGDVGIQGPINELTRLMVDRNLAFNPTEIKEFLSTTIGEIFSNSINHSAQDITFFMFDITLKNECILLYVNIIDYGTTIVENVREYVHRTENILKSSKDCMDWAVQSGNTTRSGSGGYGLSTLIDYITAVQGDLYIFSGDAYYRLEDGRIEIDELSAGRFAGTSVTFKVELFKDTSSILKYDPVEEKLTCISLDRI